jgi:hypothetical protein
MARKISRANGASWGTGKGMWGTIDGVTWLPAKKAWAADGGTWKQVWPPDQAFTSFAVTATSAEPGTTSSLISWAIDTSVPGTVSIQRKTPAGVWSDVYTGQPLSGSQTLNPLIPTQGSAGTWQFRAAFIPTHDPTFITYSALDNVTVTVPSVTLTVTATTGEVYFTSSNMTWSTSGTMPGTVKLQRKLGVGGSWTDFATGLAKSSSGSYVLAPAGAANNGTWYYRAVFTPTHDAAWNILSAEDSATVSYRAKGTSPTGITLTSLDGYEIGSYTSDFNPFIGILDPNSPAYVITDDAFTDYGILSSAQVTITGFNARYFWDNGSGGDSWYSWQANAQPVGSAISFTLTREFNNPANIYFEEATPSQYMWRDSSSRTWNQLIPVGWTLGYNGPYPLSPTWGRGVNQIGTVSASVAFTFVDGQVITVTVNTGGAWVFREMG